MRAEDPLIVAAREEGRRLGRFPEHGDLLDRWIAPLFADETAELARLRHAACLLADVGWRANPEFRAERGVEIALHGNWVGDRRRRPGADRAGAAHQLGRDDRYAGAAGRLAGADELAVAMRWGLAMRLGQRLSGGVAGPLERSALATKGKKLVLKLGAADRALYGETVERRHRALAQFMGLEARLA